MESFRGFELWGVVKETGVDDKGLMDFKQVFPHLLYRDVNMTFYEAFGNKKLSIWSLLYFLIFRRAEYKQMVARFEEKGLSGNLKGEGLVLGGVVVFDAKGQPRYAYKEEDSKQVIPIDDVVSALNALRKEAEMSK
jgi:AhpC/TSA antioxidant enzyme